MRKEEIKTLFFSQRLFYLCATKRGFIFNLNTMPDKPRNIILLISDSLRFDSVYDAGIGMPYIQQHATQFTEMRAGGCWTLPATASLFTGMLPHEHGATAQTRAIREDIPTLAEQMQQAGYKTYQITANVATTHIFGLNRGFDEVFPVWKIMQLKGRFLSNLFAIFSKPRLRKKFLAGDFISRKISEDFDSAKVWIESTYPIVFNKAREIIAENERKGERTFLFLNLMETHFPYHISESLKLDSFWIWDKVKEISDMFKFSNQKFLIKGSQDLSPQRLMTIFSRQRRAWQRLAPAIDGFCKELHQDTGNLVVFGADHGENFGDEDWNYHFSNVTDAGNKVPMFWMDHNRVEAKTVDTLVSARHLYNSFLRSIGKPTDDPALNHDPERSLAILESFWYNNDNQTHANYKYNQFSFLYNGYRFLWRNGKWFEAPFHASYERPDYQPISGNDNPIEEWVKDSEHKLYLKDTLAQFEAFAAKISFDLPLVKH